MPASPHQIKLDGKRLSIGLFADTDDALWQLVRCSRPRYEDMREADLRSNVEERARLARALIEESAAALEAWVTKQLETGYDIDEIRRVVTDGAFRFEVTPCRRLSADEVLHGMGLGACPTDFDAQPRAYGAAARRAENWRAVRQLLKDARDDETA